MSFAAEFERHKNHICSLCGVRGFHRCEVAEQANAIKAAQLVQPEELLKAEQMQSEQPQDQGNLAVNGRGDVRGSAGRGASGTRAKLAVTIKNAHTLADMVHTDSDRSGPIEALHLAIDMLADALKKDGHGN